MTNISQPYPFFTDKDGSPLSQGYIYIGEYGKDAETHQIPVFWDAEMTQPAAQPIRTIAGLPSNALAASGLFVAGGYSITTKDSSQVVVLNEQKNAGEKAEASFETIADLESDTTMSYASGATAGDVVMVLDGGLVFEVVASGGTGTVQNSSVPPVVFKPVDNQVADIRLFGAKEGDAAANRAALLAAIAFFTTGNATIHFPPGKWEIASGADIVIQTQDMTIIGAGAATHVELDGCALKWDAVAAGTHLFRCGIKDLNISRIGTAGAVIHLNGDSNMGVSRFGISNVHILGSSSNSGDGLLAQGAWSSYWCGGSVSGCLNGIYAKMAVGGSSANAWDFDGLEIQGNVNGMRLDSIVGVNLRTTIEGNSHYGILAENNVRSLNVAGYFEKNGSTLGASGRDILIGDTAYSGTKNTGYGSRIWGYFSDAGAGKKCAIEITRQNDFKIEDATVFVGYNQGGVMINPEGGAIARVNGKVGMARLISGTPEIIIDSAGAAYGGNQVKPDAASAIKTYSLTFDPPNATSGATATLAVTATGVKSGDIVIGASSAVNRQGCEIFFRCTADDEITMYVSNASALAKDIGTGSWEITVMDKVFAE